MTATKWRIIWVNWSKSCKISLSRCLKFNWKQETTTLVLSNSPKWTRILNKIILRIPWIKTTSHRKKLKKWSTMRIIRGVQSEQISKNLMVSSRASNHTKKKCLTQSPKIRMHLWPRNMASISNSKNSSWGHVRLIICDYRYHNDFMV